MLGLKRASKETREARKARASKGQADCDCPEAWCGLRERDRWKVLDCILEEVDDPFPTLVWFTR